MMRLKDKTVLVTASTRGIGQSVVKACAQEGAQVYMAARDMERAEAMRHKLAGEGLYVKCVYNDAVKVDTFAQMVDDVVADAGRIDVLVNNFGTSDPKKDLDLTHTSSEDFFTTLVRNLQSVFLPSQAAAKHMARQGGGSIINISSIGGLVPDISQIAYGTSKAAVNYLTKLIAVQEAANGIRCNAVLPGMTATESVQEKLTGAFRERFLSHVPLGRMALPGEIAAAVVYLASDEAAYVTGQCLSVAGGFGLGTPLYGELSRYGEKR